MARGGARNFRMGLLALVISTMLWGIAHGSSSVERGLDIPVSFHDLPDDLVITGQSTDQVNIRVRVSRAALRNLSPAKLEYVVDVAGAKPGLGAYEVDVSRFDMPRGTNVVSRSPATAFSSKSLLRRSATIISVAIECRFESPRRETMLHAQLIESPQPLAFPAAQLEMQILAQIARCQLSGNF